MNEIMVNAGALIDEIENEQDNLFDPADYVELIERFAARSADDQCPVGSDCGLAFQCPFGRV